MEGSLSRSAHKGLEYRRQSVYAWLFVLLEAAIILVLLFLLLFSPVRVNGPSMSPTLQQGEILLIDRISLYLRTPDRGAMVIFSRPGTDEELIKRIIALPGETVDIVGGSVYVNGRKLDESAYASAHTDDFEPLTVPEGCVFVLGDQRGESLDSRDPALGCIPMQAIDGRVRFRVSPLGRISIFI